MKSFFLGLLAVIALIAIWCVSSYNGIIGLDENVKKAWGNVETQYQKRADLTPQLVEIVKGAANNEQTILTEVIEARASATSMNVDLQSAEEMAEFQAKQTGFSQALGRLMAISEAYPTIQSNQNFLGLQAEVSGIANRISTEQIRYNEAVSEYNNKVRTFPVVIFASMFGFDKYESFKSEEGAQTAPDLTGAFE